MMTEHIVAIFETESAADAAARDLEEAGISGSAIRRYKPQTMGRAETNNSLATSKSSTGRGFWAWLAGEEPDTETTHSLHPRDEEVYERGVQAGKTVLSVMIHDDSQIHQTVTILDAHHPIGIEDNAEETTRGYSESVSQPSPSLGAVVPPPAPLTGRVNPVARGSDALPALSGGEEIVPLAEEKIEVGKRTVDRGTTRVRRYVVETPVEREVTLAGE